MSISASYPEISPSLMLDFANSKTVDPRITFTRSTTATYYDGVTTAKAEENLLLRSQDYSATWTVTNLTPVTGKTAPDSTSTATEFTADAANSTITQSITAIAADYTFSVYLRRITGTGDIDITADGSNWVTQSITSSWARYDVTQTLTAGTRTPGVRIVTSGDQIEVWGAQAEIRSAVTSYTATTSQPITNYIPVLQTAAAGVPRIDHNPTTGETLGLLIEEQRTNLLTYSEQFDNAAWSKTNITIDSNSIVAPDGTLTGDKFTGTSGLSNTAVSNGSSLNGTYSFSIYAKAGSDSVFDMSIGSGAVARATMNVSTGAIIATTGSGYVNSTITSVGNGWYRCTVVGTTTFGGVNVNTSYGVASDGSHLFFWGAQLEAGAFPTSYIPTTSAQETRNADAASMTGTNFSSWYNAGEGTLYTESTTTNSFTNPRYAASLTDGTVNNYSAIFYSAGSLAATAEIAVNNAVQLGTSGQFVTLSASGKIALSYEFNNTVVAYNGASNPVDTTCLIPNNLTKLDIGGRLDSSTRYLNGTIKKIAYYPQRLSDANLQALTS